MRKGVVAYKHDDKDDLWDFKIRGTLSSILYVFLFIVRFEYILHHALDKTNVVSGIYTVGRIQDKTSPCRIESRRVH